jgi:hypothetical protein
LDWFALVGWVGLVQVDSLVWFVFGWLVGWFGLVWLVEFVRFVPCFVLGVWIGLVGWLVWV